MFGRREVCEPRVSVAQAVAMVSAGHQPETVAPFLRGRREQRVFLARVEARFRAGRLVPEITAEMQAEYAADVAAPGGWS